MTVPSILNVWITRPELGGQFWSLEMTSGVSLQLRPRLPVYILPLVHPSQRRQGPDHLIRSDCLSGRLPPLDLNWLPDGRSTAYFNWFHYIRLIIYSFITIDNCALNFKYLHLGRLLVSIRKINVCPFHYTGVADSGMVERPLTG